MFYNHNQEVSTKIYNKLVDLKNQNYDTVCIKGLLRFELTLKRNFLKNNGLIKSGNNSIEELSKMFPVILDNAEALMQKHIVGPMWNSNFLSKKLQKKYIKRYCKIHEAKYIKMIGHCDDCKKALYLSTGKQLTISTSLTYPRFIQAKSLTISPLSRACSVKMKMRR
jgi:hypothetical protein